MVLMCFNSIFPGFRWLIEFGLNVSDGSMIIFHWSSEFLGKDMFINGSRVPLQIPGTP
jgi:hypothetical protein